MASQNADGQAHFTYFDKGTQLSFVWDGKSDHIDVCHGGYGEPVIDLYKPESMRRDINTTPVNWLDWYRRVCQLYVASWKESA